MTRQDITDFWELYNADVPHRLRECQQFMEAYPGFPWKLVMPKPVNVADQMPQPPEPFHVPVKRFGR